MSILTQMDFNDVKNINLFENMQEISEIFVTTLLSQMGIDYSLEEIHSLIDEWAFGPTNELPFYITLKTKKPVDLWKRIITYSKWKTIGKAIIQIVSIGTSEANCERFISRQREVTGEHGTNYSCESMEPRLQIISASSIAKDKE